MADDTDRTGRVIPFIALKPQPEPTELILDPAKYGDVIDLTVRRYNFEECQHTAEREISLRARRITCTGCNRDLDPFQCLHDVATRWEHQVFRWKQLCDDIAAATERLATLRREEANARARTKRLRERGAGDEKP